MEDTFVWQEQKERASDYDNNNNHWHGLKNDQVIKINCLVLKYCIFKMKNVMHLFEFFDKKVIIYHLCQQYLISLFQIESLLALVHAGCYEV